MILLDTCAIVWSVLTPKQLSTKATRAISQAEKANALIVADISLWEIAMLIKKRRVEIDTTAGHFLNLFLQSRNVSVKPISPEIAELSANLNATINADPADRIIAATSIMYNARLVTADQNLIACDMLDTVW